MPDIDPKPRSYQSKKRASQAAETREAVLTAARELFLVSGWGRTTIAGIASAAGVSKETIYGVFGSKTAVLKEVIQRSIRGASPDTPLIEQEAPKRIAGLKDQFLQIDAFSEDIAGVLGRVAPLMDVVRVAAGTDAAIAEIYAGLHRGRRRNLQWFTAALSQNGTLRGEMEGETAATIIWRLASPDLYLLMRRVEEISDADYTHWLAASLKCLLLEERE